MPQICASESNREILTPKPPAGAKVNGATIYGARLGHEFLYRIPCTGERPIQFAAPGLPASLRLDPATGIITGRTPDKPGTYAVMLQASNAKGKSSRLFRIVVGDTLALTPPMGWNSWYSYYEQVTDKVVREAADNMITSGMADFGYQYVNVDGGWQVNNNGKDPEVGGEPRDAKGNINSQPPFSGHASHGRLHPRQRSQGWFIHFARSGRLRRLHGLVSTRGCRRKAICGLGIRLS